jgi:magnesium-transporting ATPase (P-type)
MTVEAFYAQNSAIQNTRPNTLHHCKMTDKTIDLIATGIIYNSNVHIEMTPDALYEPVGNGTETALFRWLQGAQLPVHDIIKQKEGRIAV